MGAMKMLRDHMKEALILSGKMQSLEASRKMALGDGTIEVQTISGPRLNPIGSKTMAMLEAAKEIDDIIEVSHTDLEETQDGKGTDTKADGGKEGNGGPEEYRDVDRSAFSAQPERDVGGGGLCFSAQREAKAQREAYHHTLEESNTEPNPKPQAEPGQTVDTSSEPGRDPLATEPDSDERGQSDNQVCSADHVGSGDCSLEEDSSPDPEGD